MNRFFYKYFIFIFLTISCDSFDNWLCGEIDSELKENIEQANDLYPKEFKVEIIPCEYSYLNIHALNKSVDTTKIDSIQTIICTRQNPTVWNSIDVYDSEGNYLFSRSNSGKISIIKSR